MHITELGLTAVSQAALEAAGLSSVEELVRHPADDLLARPACIGPFELFEVVCRLSERGYSLPPVRNGSGLIPSDRNRELLRLRIIEGLSLREAGRRVGLTTERVRQLLRACFGLSGIPPAVRATRRQRRR